MSGMEGGDKSEAESARRDGLVLAVALVAVVLFIASCGKTTSSNAKLSGEVGNQTQDIISGLQPSEKDCIEQSPDAATAAAKCVSREQLADQVVEQLRSNPVVSSLDKDAQDELLKCYRKALEDLDDSDIGDLAGSDKSVMRKLQDKLVSCAGSATPTSKFKSVGSAIS